MIKKTHMGIYNKGDGAYFFVMPAKRRHIVAIKGKQVVIEDKHLDV